MACHVGEEIWKRYRIPVYLYESAARIPERQGLENIRRGQFEGIRAEIATALKAISDRKVMGKILLRP